MITLGIVQNVDVDGVYVIMPGSRGLLRGPYKSLSTVEADDTVLMVTTDDGEVMVVGRWNKTGQIDQTKIYTSGSTQFVESQGYVLRIKTNGSAAYLQFAYGGGFTFSGAKVTITHADGVEYASGGPRDMSGSGDPNGAYSAPVGSTFRRTDGGAGTAFYVKESGGTGNTGWVGK